MAISVAIPTYGREQVLLDTVRHLLALAPAPAEILLVDQTPKHEPGTEAQLREWDAQGAVRWLRQAEPSIPVAMNAALLAAREDVVLFVDDDVVPEPHLLAAHEAAHRAHPGGLVAGRVIQPWHEGRDLSADPPFSGVRAQPVDHFMGGNFSVRRADAVAVGGFDENFVRVAYRFEEEFAHRWRASGRALRFEPAACLHHLKAGSGGTRTFGEHLVTWRPDHAVGAYYFGLRTGARKDFFTRPWRAVATRFHLRRPWRILPTLVAELRAMAWAIRLHARGPKLLQDTGRGAPP